VAGEMTGLRARAAGTHISVPSTEVLLEKLIEPAASSHRLRPLEAEGVQRPQTWPSRVAGRSAKDERIFARCPVGSVLLALVLACGVVACRAPEPPPNVLLITIDTLRADHLGFAGHDRPTSPRIDALAREGVVFTNTSSAAGWTLPAMASILTGHHPKEHRATLYTRRMRSSLPSLAEILAEAGYDTRGFVSHVMLQSKRGISEGFSKFDDSVLRVGNPHNVSTAEPLTSLVLRSLLEDPPDRPLFLWVHYFDPHAHYMAQPEGVGFGSDDLARYDGEIAHTDAQIARLLEHLETWGLLDRAVIVLTSDHGEEFWEHGHEFHGQLHEEVIRVPLVLRAPGLAPDVRDDPAAHVDLLPTILALLDIEPPASLPGVDLLAGPDALRPIFFERDIPNGFAQRGVRVGSLKLIEIREVDPEPNQLRSGPAGPAVVAGIQFYDLARDPGEQHPLPASDPRQRALLERLRDHFRAGVD
jgi:arylsulfatase A-like enzyme